MEKSVVVEIGMKELGGWFCLSLKCGSEYSRIGSEFLF